MNDEILRIDNLSKSFGGVTAVSGCTFSVTQGMVLGLIGPNGAGKSTVVDLVSGFGRPDAGRITFAGTAITGMRPDTIARLGLIRTFQRPREWRHLTVLQNVLVTRCAYSRESLLRTIVDARRLRRDEMGDRVAAMELLERYQLSVLRVLLAGELAGGQI